jgi:hypothetical protein
MAVRDLAARLFEFDAQQLVWRPARKSLIKSFDRLRTNGHLLIPFVVSLSNHIQI